MAPFMAEEFKLENGEARKFDPHTDICFLATTRKGKLIVLYEQGLIMKKNDVNRMLNSHVLFGVSFLFTLLLFKTRDGSSGVARRKECEARANIFREFPRE